MKTETLEALNDEELQSVIARCNELLKARDRERKDKALEQAKAILAVAGLSFKDVASGKLQRSGNGRTPAYQGGRHYRHPSKPELVWNAKGQKPN